jgi:hypothetical protein
VWSYSDKKFSLQHPQYEETHITVIMMWALAFKVGTKTPNNLETPDRNYNLVTYFIDSWQAHHTNGGSPF